MRSAIPCTFGVPLVYSIDVQDDAEDEAGDNNRDEVRRWGKILRFPTQEEHVFFLVLIQQPRGVLQDLQVSFHNLGRDQGNYLGTVKLEDTAHPGSWVFKISRPRDPPKRLPIPKSAIAQAPLSEYHKNCHTLRFLLSIIQG
jgi:hypothetical protein